MLRSAGAFNDPDYLLFRDASGRYAQTAVQTRLQFSVYAMLAAPLIVSQDLTRTRDDPFVLQTLLNREVIGVDQDALGNGCGGGGGGGGGGRVLRCVAPTLGRYSRCENHRRKLHLLRQPTRLRVRVDAAS